MHKKEEIAAMFTTSAGEPINSHGRSELIHIHPIYSGLYCGVGSGIYHTSEKDITCPECLIKMRCDRNKLVADHAKAMLDTLNLPKNADKGHWGDITLQKLLRHLDEEVEEFKAAVWGNTSFKKPHSRVVSEGADVSNVIAMITDNLRGGP